MACLVSSHYPRPCDLLSFGFSLADCRCPANSFLLMKDLSLLLSGGASSGSVWPVYNVHNCAYPWPDIVLISVGQALLVRIGVFFALCARPEVEKKLTSP